MSFLKDVILCIVGLAMIKRRAVALPDSQFRGMRPINSISSGIGKEILNAIGLPSTGTRDFRITVPLRGPVIIEAEMFVGSELTDVEWRRFGVYEIGGGSSPKE